MAMPGGDNACLTFLSAFHDLMPRTRLNPLHCLTCSASQYCQGHQPWMGNEMALLGLQLCQRLLSCMAFHEAKVLPNLFLPVLAVRISGHKQESS